MPNEIDYMHQTVMLAKAAGKAGNLPIGVVIVLDGKIIAEGQNGYMFRFPTRGGMQRSMQ